MDFEYEEIYGEIGSLIYKGNYRRAISMIHKHKQHNNIAAIMYFYHARTFPIDNLYTFLYEYIEHGQLSFKIDTPKIREGHVLTIIQKELDKEIYPRRRIVRNKLMQHFVFRLLTPPKRRKAISSEEMELFSFRPVNKYLTEQLGKGEIQVTNPDKFNDPFDCLIMSAIRREKEKLKTEHRKSVKTYVEELKRIRVCCFAGWDTKKEPPYLNTLMWSHYAKFHTGICIKYSILANEPVWEKGISDSHSRSLLDKVIYKEEPFVNKDVLSYQECFLYKDKVWKYENEYRLLHYDCQQKGNFITIPLSALGLKIEAVYFGLNCSLTDRMKVKEALKEQDVEFYNIEYDNTSMNRIKRIHI